ncbi:MAG TPA: cytochrome c biogenesis protein ResB [Candidatus Limnocylindrales bacterium]
MTQKVHTPPLPQAAAAARPAAAANTTVMDRVDAGLEGLWHLLTSMRVAMVLMIGLAILSLAGSLLIQMTAEQAADPAQHAQFIDMVRGRYGGWAPILDALGLFTVFNSLIFRILMAALSISLVACTVHRIPGVWRTATKPRIDVGPSFFEHAPQREQIAVHGSSAETLSAVQAVLRKRRYRTLVTDDGTVHLYADRFRFMAFASLAGHVSLVLILAGAIIGSTFGYRNTQFVIAEGSTLPTGTEAGLALKLIDFTDTWYTGVANLPSDYASQVELYRDGTKVAAQTIRVNEPLSYNGATYYQSSYGSAVVVTVKDSAGKVVYDGGLPLEYTFGSDNRAGGVVDLAGSSNQIYIIGTSGSSDTLVQPGQVLAELVNPVSSTTIDQGTVDQGKTRTLGGYSVTFSREAKYSVLSINRDPGQLLVWLGALLLFGGFTLVFLLPQRRVWARISARGAVSVLSIATLGRRDAALGTDFDALITDIRAALQAPAKA